MKQHRVLASRAVVPWVLALGLAATVTGCSGDKQDDSSADVTPTVTPTSTVSLPAGASITAQGTELDFGQEAIVEYSPNRKPGTVLSLIVDGARAAKASDFKGFDLNTDYKKNGSYYYADVTVKNLGTKDAGGWAVPISGVNESDVLLPPVLFTSAFKPCPSKSLPKKFAQNATFSTCLVYLSPNHGQLAALSFAAPDGDAAKAITWAGDVKPAKRKTTPTKQPTPTKSKG